MVYFSGWTWSRFPRTHHVLASGRHSDDRAHGVGRQGGDGPLLRRPAGDQTGDRRHRGGQDGLARQPSEGTTRAACFLWNNQEWNKGGVRQEVWQVISPADGSSLPGLCVLLQVGQTLLQGTRRFPAGQSSSKHIHRLCRPLVARNDTCTIRIKKKTSKKRSS